MSSKLLSQAVSASPPAPPLLPPPDDDEPALPSATRHNHATDPGRDDEVDVGTWMFTVDRCFPVFLPSVFRGGFSCVQNGVTVNSAPQGGVGLDLE